MFELEVKIENTRRYLQNLLSVKDNLLDKDVINTSQELDMLLNRYYSMKTIGLYTEMKNGKVAV